MIAFLIIPGSCALFSPRALELKRRPLFRDAATYATALALLCIFFSDGVIYTYEAAILVGCYVIYVLIVFLSPNIRAAYQAKQRHAHHKQQLSAALLDGADQDTLDQMRQQFTASHEKKSFVQKAAEEKKRQQEEAKQQQKRINGDSDENSNVRLVSSLTESDEHNDSSDVDLSIRDDLQVNDDDEEEGPPTMIGKIWETATSPLLFLFRLTCIDCVHDGPKAKWYPLTFAVAFLWVSVFSFLIAAIVERWVDLSGVSLSFFGLVLVAVGAEIPDTIQSVTVARRGYGSMAVSNSAGSQITNILVGLGLPWLIADIQADSRGKKEDLVHVGDHSNLQKAAFFQFGNLSLFITILLIAALVTRSDKAILNKTKGVIFVCTYVACLAGYAAVIFS